MAEPFPLLTIRRIATLARQSVSTIRWLLDEHPDIQPTARADYEPVYDRDAFLRLLVLVDQEDARCEGGAT